jgi:hypothetical protein
MKLVSEYDSYFFFSIKIYFGSSDSRLWSSNGTRQNRSRLVVASKYFGYTSMGDSELTRYVTWADAKLGQFNNTQSNGVGQWSAVHKHPTELIYLAVLRYLRVAYYPTSKNKCEILIQVSPFSIQINFYSYIMRYYDHADVLVFFTVQRKNKLPYFGPIRTHSWIRRIGLWFVFIWKWQWLIWFNTVI